MAKMTANRSMSAIRGKYKVNGSGKPKRGGNKFNGLTWQE